MKRLMSPLYRLVVRLRYGASFSHADMWLPFLRLTKPDGNRGGEIFYKERKVGSLVSADALAKAAGNQIFIIGSGPSVNDNDLSPIPERAAILLNGAISLLGQGLQKALAVVIEDERFIRRHFDLLKARIGPDTVCLFSVPVLKAICEADEDWLADKTIILIDNVRKPYGNSRREAIQFAGNAAAVLEADGQVGFSLDPDWGVFQGGSVVVSAMQFAVYCSPSAIGLLGIDISNANEPRFYEASGNTAKSGVRFATDRIVSHLQLARRVGMDKGIMFLNYSPVSILRRQRTPPTLREKRSHPSRASVSVPYFRATS